MNTRIAYIDDCRANLECLELIFNSDFPFDTFVSPVDFLDRFSDTSYASILMDVHMPAMSGFSLYELIVKHPNYNGCPVLFISSDASDVSRLKSFELGAVDFISRLAPPDELVARVKSKIEFFRMHRNVIEFGSLKVNLTLLKTFVGGNEIPLTFIELKILCLALRKYPDVISKEEVVSEVWRSGQSQDGPIYTHLSNLNAKLRGWDHEVQSIKGRGIQLVKIGGVP